MSARCFPSSRLGTASIRSSLSLPPGFLFTREAGTCAGSRAWSSFSPCLVPSPYSTTYSGYAQARLKNTTSCCGLWIMVRRTSSRLFFVLCLFVLRCTFLSAIASSEALLCPMTGWVCQWKPFWIPVEDSFKQAYLEEWVFISDVPSEGPSFADQGELIPETPRVPKLASSSPWEPAKPQDKACSWERIEAPLPPLRARPECDLIHQQRLSYEELVCSGSDHVTMWGKMSPHEILAEHVVDIHKVVADFRDAFERNQSSSSQTHGVNKYFSSQSPVQKRLSIYNWNRGRDVERKTLFEKQIAGKWHIVTLQEASDYVEPDILQERFRVTHYAGCAILFNKDIFYPDISVKSIYLHDTRRGLQDHVVEGEQGWVLQGVLSRASFRRGAVSGQKFFTVLSLQISNIYAKKKGIAKKLIQTLRAMISQEVDLVARHFNGTAWRCRSRDNSVLLIKCFLIAPCLRHQAPHRCGDPDPSRTIGLMSVHFSTPRLSAFLESK